MATLPIAVHPSGNWKMTSAHPIPYVYFVNILFIAFLTCVFPICAKNNFSGVQICEGRNFLACARDRPLNYFQEISINYELSQRGILNDDKLGTYLPLISGKRFTISLCSFAKVLRERQQGSVDLFERRTVYVGFWYAQYNTRRFFM